MISNLSSWGRFSGYRNAELSSEVSMIVSTFA
jgi:hypothetical protein